MDGYNTGPSFQPSPLPAQPPLTILKGNMVVKGRTDTGRLQSYNFCQKEGARLMNHQPLFFVGLLLSLLPEFYQLPGVFPCLRKNLSLN
jgi:hypothetical protein